jgi:ribosomal protein S18 acetylase RimI-like enzyme
MADARRATPRDAPLLVKALARAFEDDPVAMWSCPSDALRPRVLEDFYVVRLRQILSRGEVWTVEGCQSGALWSPPGTWRNSPREDLELARCLLRPRLLPRMPLVISGLLGMERRHPAHPPHWYLTILGTEPSAQGNGLASAVLAPVLEECDADGVGAYLESSKERNIAFYSRHGFRVTGEIDLPRGPRMWSMWRDPRS